MSLIKSIAGVRGTIGGQIGSSLTPIDVVSITAAFAKQVILPTSNPIVIIGRDARRSGDMISQLVSATLQSLGIHVIDLELSTTPTITLAIIQEKASGGIAITASHNPASWNALKLFNNLGEYIDAATANSVFQGENESTFVETDQLGTYRKHPGYIDKHIAQIINLPLVNKGSIKQRKFKVVVDAVNSTGGIAVPKLLQNLDVAYTELYCNPTGIFPHDPEPLTHNLTDLIKLLKTGAYDLGIAVDPDVDRLVIIDEKGEPWGEDYTLVAAADYILKHTPGNTVSNLSSSSALQVVTEKHGQKHTGCPVGEMYVVAKMKETNSVIGGEGNGGVIYPTLHYSRDALVGIALILSHLAETGMTASKLRQQYPTYTMRKIKIQLTPDIQADMILENIKNKYTYYPANTEEGLKVFIEEGWFHLRKSNTEPIVRLYAEAPNQTIVHKIVNDVLQHIKTIFPTVTIS